MDGYFLFEFTMLRFFFLYKLDIQSTMNENLSTKYLQCFCTCFDFSLNFEYIFFVTNVFWQAHWCLSVLKLSDSGDIPLVGTSCLKKSKTTSSVVFSPCNSYNGSLVSILRLKTSRMASSELFLCQLHSTATYRELFSSSETLKAAIGKLFLWTFSIFQSKSDIWWAFQISRSFKSVFL